LTKWTDCASLSTTLQLCTTQPSDGAGPNPVSQLIIDLGIVTDTATKQE